MDLEAADDRVAELAQAFVELAGALADGYDVVELLDRLIRRCVHLLKVDAAGLVLADASGTLKVMAATDEQARFLEVLQLHADSGPCMDCYRSGQPVDVHDLTLDDDRWPALADTIRHGGYHAVTPKIVLEVAFDQIQKSARHASGFALRFPRVKRIRWDKAVEDADRLARVAEIYDLHANTARALHVPAPEPKAEPTLFDEID